MLESVTENLGCFLVTIVVYCGLADETPANIVLSQKRLVGERMVVKEIEIFGNLWYPQLGRIEDIAGAGRMAFREKTVAQIEQRAGKPVRFRQT